MLCCVNMNVGERKSALRGIWNNFDRSDIFRISCKMHQKKLAFYTVYSKFSYFLKEGSMGLYR